MYLFLIFVISFILLWFRTNYPPYRELADLYLWFAAIGMIWWTTDFVVSLAASKNQTNPPPYTQIINTAFYEKNTMFGPIPFSWRIGTYIFTAFVCVMLAFWIGAAETTIIGVPSFQIIDLGVTGIVIVTISMAIMEDIVFFGLLAPTVSGMGRVLSMGNQLIGAVLSLAVTPVAFMLYHFLVYGATDIPSSMFTWAFALVCTSWVLIMRNLIFVNALHITNNISLKVAHAFGIAVGG